MGRTLSPLTDSGILKLPQNPGFGIEMDQAKIQKAGSVSGIIYLQLRQ